MYVSMNRILRIYLFIYTCLNKNRYLKSPFKNCSLSRLKAGVIKNLNGFVPIKFLWGYYIYAGGIYYPFGPRKVTNYIELDSKAVINLPINHAEKVEWNDIQHTANANIDFVSIFN